LAGGDFATVGLVHKPQGRHGEVNVEVLTDFPDRFEAGEKFLLWREGEERREMELEDAWPHKRGLVLKFAGVDSIEDAELLQGWEIQVPMESRPALEGSAVYHSDLIGCRVVERGEDLGIVVEIEERTGTPLLIVKNGDQELMIPFADEICRVVDTARGVVEVELPAGLRDLN
jgi:16S rRNA processing protein RimM